jgi:hypothetical protein
MRRWARPTATGPAGCAKWWLTEPSTSPATPRSRPLALIAAVHTLIWISIESCVVYVLGAGLAGRSDRSVAIAGTIVAAETLVFAANGFRCPLTDLAESHGAARGSVTDIYLPAWLAHNLPAIHVPVILLSVVLHGRNLRRRRKRPAPGPPA